MQAELVALVAGIARTRVELPLTEEELKVAIQNGQRRRRGARASRRRWWRSLGRRRTDLRRSIKPEPADAMADKILEEINGAVRQHEEVAVPRPIVRWVMDVPLTPYRT